MSDEPTLSEIARQIDTLRADLRAALSERLRTDVYRAEQRLTEEKIHILETRIAVSEEDRRQIRRLVAGAVATGGVSILFQLISSALNHAG